MPAVETTDETCVIVVNLGQVDMGIVVDQVQEVLDIVEDDVEDAPSFGVSVDTDFILGMGKTDDNVTILLDINKVLEEQEVAELAEVM